MPKGLKRALSALLIAIFLYSLIGFLILPGIALRVANQQLAQYAVVPASLSRVQFNPYSLELSLWGLTLGEPNAPDVAAERLYVNLASDSLWRGVLHLSAVQLDGLKSTIAFSPKGRLNLAHLFNLPASETNSEPSAPLPVRIDSLRLNDGALRFEDLRPTEPVTFAYHALNLELNNLSTLSDEHSGATLSATGPDGSSLHWQGQLSLVPLTSSGRLELKQVQLSTFWPYVRDALPLVLKNGALTLSSEYELDLQTGTELKLSQLTAQLSPLALEDAQGNPLLALTSLTLSGSALDLHKQRVTLGTLSSDGLQVWAARGADGLLNWQSLLGKSDEAQSPASAPDKQPWQVQLNDVQLHNAMLFLRDNLPKENVELTIGPLNAEAQNISTLGEHPFTLNLNTGIGKSGQLSANGEIQLSPPTVELKVHTADIDLRIAQAYLSPFLRLELRSGMLGSDVQVRLKQVEPLQLSVTGTAHVDQLHTLDTLRERDLVRWKRVSVNGINYQHGASLSLDNIALEQPYARFVINENLSTNINDLIIAQPPSAPAATPSKPLAMRIGGIAINDGSANFADFSLTPNFATAIQQMNGQIGQLDNQQALPAKIDIRGKVDRYAPMSITGQLTPFDPLNSLDINTRFNNVELTTMTPYSGKFAGYRIRKGRLNLDLYYRIEKGQLDAQNKVVVENLQLGERVDSPDAVNLPIRLAVALLKDADGNITVELPVSGNLNDPQFSVMPIVWKTLSNLVVRAAQAPFNFIAGLVSSNNVDLSSVTFNPGSAELDERAHQSLNTLAKALSERPALRLEIEGQSSAAADGSLLAEQRLQREFQQTWYKVLQRRGDKVPANSSALTVSESEQAALLEGIYRARLKQQPPAQWQDLDKAQRLANMRQAVIDSWASSSSLLRQLAQQRAAAIKQYLVEQGLADERLYLIDASLTETDADGRVSTTLHLDSA